MIKNVQKATTEQLRAELHDLQEHLPKKSAHATAIAAELLRRIKAASNV